MTPQLNIQFRLPIEIKQAAALFISSCPILDVHSQGNDEDHARANLVEAVQLFIETCFEMGTLEQVLRESGFQPLHHQPEQSQPTPIDMIDVPIYFESLNAANHAH